MYQLEAHQTIRVDIIRFEFSDNDIDCSRQHTASQRHCSSQIRPQTTPLHNASNGVQSRRVNKIWLFSLHTAREWQRERERESEREAHQPNNNVRINNVWQLQTTLLQWTVTCTTTKSRSSHVCECFVNNSWFNRCAVNPNNHKPPQRAPATLLLHNNCNFWCHTLKNFSLPAIFFFFFFEKKFKKTLFLKKTISLEKTILTFDNELNKIMMF